MTTVHTHVSHRGDTNGSLVDPMPPRCLCNSHSTTGKRRCFKSKHLELAGPKLQCFTPGAQACKHRQANAHTCKNITVRSGQMSKTRSTAWTVEDPFASRMPDPFLQSCTSTCCHTAARPADVAITGTCMYISRCMMTTSSSLHKPPKSVKWSPHNAGKLTDSTALFSNQWYPKSSSAATRVPSACRSRALSVLPA